MPGQSFGGASVVSAGSGWWRVILTGTLPEAGATAILGVLSGGARTFAGNGTSAIFAWGASLTQALDARPFALTQGAVAGPLIFNPPAALTQNSRETWAALAGGPRWGGADIYVSLDGGSTYEFIGSTSQAAARFGALTASFASGADPDTTHTCSVDLSASATGNTSDTSGTLTSAADAVADGDGTLCLINDASPELISFSTATLTDPNRYDIKTYTRRGQLGTPIGAHSAQAPFIRLDDAPFVFPFLAPNVGSTVFAKFLPFNIWGQRGNLANCIAYPFTPASSVATNPGASAFSVVGGTLSNAGQSIPALLISGTCDNPSATDVVFFYRPHGSGAWISAGKHPASLTYTNFPITSLAPSASYDVGVAYVVQGSVGAIQTMSGSPATAGVVTGSGSGSNGPGTVLLDTSDPSVTSFNCPAGSYGHVDIQIFAADGGNFWKSWFPEPSAEAGGSGAYAISTGNAVTPGTTSISFSLGTVGADAGASHGGGTNASPGGGSSVTSPAITVGGGFGASEFAKGVGGTVGSGGTQTAGVAGAAVGSNGRIVITARA